jgi:hypothetical protein
MGAGLRKADEIIPLPRVAKAFKLKLRTVEDRSWRQRAGLRVVRLGGRILGVRAEDLAAALRRDW